MIADSIMTNQENGNLHIINTWKYMIEAKYTGVIYSSSDNISIQLIIELENMKEITSHLDLK